MKKKVTKSFALDELAIDILHEIKDELKFKSDSEVVYYALFDLYSDLEATAIKERLEQLIAKHKYQKAYDNVQKFVRKIK